MEVTMEPITGEIADEPSEPVPDVIVEEEPLSCAPQQLRCAPGAQVQVQPAPQAEPVKRPRGRPKGSANKPKALAAPTVPAEGGPAPVPTKAKPKKQAKRPPSSSSDSSSSEEEPAPRKTQGKRAAVRDLMEDDLETQVLKFLSARRTSQQQQRRQLWQNLATAGLGR